VKHAWIYHYNIRRNETPSQKEKEDVCGESKCSEFLLGRMSERAKGGPDAYNPV
jgi:hypothetical protein